MYDVYKIKLIFKNLFSPIILKMCMVIKNMDAGRLCFVVNLKIKKMEVFFCEGKIMGLLSSSPKLIGEKKGISSGERRVAEKHTVRNFSI